MVTGTQRGAQIALPNNPPPPPPPIFPLTCHTELMPLYCDVCAINHQMGHAHTGGTIHCKLNLAFICHLYSNLYYLVEHKVFAAKSIVHFENLKQ